MTYGDTGDTVMLPLWQMGMWRGDVWGHRGGMYGDTEGTPQCCTSGTWGGDRWGHREVVYGDAEGNSLTSPLWHMRAQEGDVEGTP